MGVIGVYFVWGSVVKDVGRVVVITVIKVCVSFLTRGSGESLF